MKYKVGDKFLVEITEINDSCYPYTLSEIGIITSEENLDKLRRQDDMTAERASMEAWDTAKRLCSMEGDMRMEILGNKYYHMGDVYEDFTPQQAKARIEAWETEKEIKVGDEVVPRDNDQDKCKFFVTYNKDDVISGFSGFTGKVFSCREIDRYIRTGRHIDIQSLLEQIGGAD